MSLDRPQSRRLCLSPWGPTLGARVWVPSQTLCGPNSALAGQRPSSRVPTRAFASLTHHFAHGPWLLFSTCRPGSASVRHDQDFVCLVSTTGLARLGANQAPPRCRLSIGWPESLFAHLGSSSMAPSGGRCISLTVAHRHGVVRVVQGEWHESGTAGRGAFWH